MPLLNNALNCFIRLCHLHLQINLDLIKGESQFVFSSFSQLYFFIIAKSFLHADKLNLDLRNAPLIRDNGCRPWVFDLVHSLLNNCINRDK